MTESNKEEIKKYPIEKCNENFKKYILGNELNSSQKSYIYINKQDLLSLGLKGDLSSIYLRPMTYKIFLNHLPIEKSLQQWISITFNNRMTYSQLKSKYFPPQSNNKDNNNISNNSFIKVNKIKNNSNIDNIQNINEKDEELKSLINLDLSRTFQEISLFKDAKILKILFNVLYIYSKEHSNTNPYKQGMNEIIAILLLSIYPCYFTCNKNISKIDIINAINSYNKKTIIVLHKKAKNELINNSYKKNFIQPMNNNNKKGIDILFNFFHDDNCLEVDLYYLFNNLMEKGFNIFYNDEIFQQKCDNIINNKLKIIDFELYQHCINIKVPFHIIFGKWIQSFFNQVTNINNCISILDIIISKEFLINDINKEIYYIKKNELYEFEFLDCILLAMIKAYRNELLKKNDEEFLIFCLCYPEIKTLNEIIQSANMINLTLKNSKIESKKINENLDKKTSLIAPKKKLFYGKSIKNKNNVSIQTNPCNTENNTSTNFKPKILIKNNTIIGNVNTEMKNNINTNSPTSKNMFNSEKINKSTKNLDIKKNNNLKENSKFSLFDKISSFSHQFDEYKSNDLIDAYYF